MPFKTFSVCAGLDISTTGNSCGVVPSSNKQGHSAFVWVRGVQHVWYCSRSRCQIIIFVGPSDLMTSMTSFGTCRANGGQCQGICSKALCIADDSLRKLGRLGKALQVSSSFKNEEIDISSYEFWDDSKVLFGEILVIIQIQSLCNHHVRSGRVRSAWGDCRIPKLCVIV